jgi:ElaB/YqjD/DUF883 family membrane-anchored ribosome-binding protein
MWRRIGLKKKCGAANPIEIHKGAKLMALDLLEKQATVEEILREISRIKSMVTEAVEDGVQSALRAAKQGRHVAEDAVDDARHAIKRNPLQAAGIVFAAGVVIGGLLTLISVRRD